MVSLSGDSSLKFALRHGGDKAHSVACRGALKEVNVTVGPEESATVVFPCGIRCHKGILKFGDA
jgi:hypothetical protein